MLASLNNITSYALPQNNINRKTTAGTSVADFKNMLSQTALAQTSAVDTSATNTTNVNSYLSQLQSKFGTGVSVRDMEYSKANINHIGSSTSRTGNVIIASNILEKMASDPQARQYYEQKIQDHFDTIGKANAFMAMHGRRVVSSGVIIHPDGKVTYYSSSDYTPEEKARLEKAMKEEDEAKAKKRAEAKRLNEIALNEYIQTPYSTQQINIFSPENPQKILLQVPTNIDIRAFQLLAYRFKNNDSL